MAGAPKTCSCLPPSLPPSFPSAQFSQAPACIHNYCPFFALLGPREKQPVILPLNSSPRSFCFLVQCWLETFFFARAVTVWLRALASLNVVNLLLPTKYEPCTAVIKTESYNTSLEGMAKKLLEIVFGKSFFYSFSHGPWAES